MNDEIKNLRCIICALIGEINGLRLIAGLPDKNYKLHGCVLYSNGEPYGEVNNIVESKELTEKCIILDIRTGKKVG